MRRDVAFGREPLFSSEARSASYAQEVEGVLRGRAGKKGEEGAFLRGVIEAGVPSAKRGGTGRKRGREEEANE